jgi:hypothetical protein
MPALVTVGLHDCQIEAVTGLEKSLAADEPRALIQAATGAGKTNTDETEELPSGWGWASIDQLTRVAYRAFSCSETSAVAGAPDEAIPAPEWDPQPGPARSA